VLAPSEAHGQINKPAFRLRGPLLLTRDRRELRFVAAGAAEAVIPQVVEVICGRARIVVSEGTRLRELRADAFAGLELDELVVPRTLEVIAAGAFREMAGPRLIRASRDGHFIGHSGPLLSRDRTKLILGQTDLVALSARPPRSARQSSSQKRIASRDSGSTVSRGISGFWIGDPGLFR